jgi:hypothetical protein
MVNGEYNEFGNIGFTFIHRTLPHAKAQSRKGSHAKAQSRKGSQRKVHLIFLPFLFRAGVLRCALSGGKRNQNPKPNFAHWFQFFHSLHS